MTGESARPPAWRIGTLPALILGALGLVAVVSACNGDSGSVTPTPSPSSSPVAGPSPTPDLTPPPPPSDIEAEASFDLAFQAPLATIYGADPGDIRSDLPPLTSGDFNDDGLPDLLLAARFGDGPANGREDSGEAYVFFGTQSLPSNIDIRVGQQDLTVWGAAPKDNLGFAATAADLNADGIDDIVLGAPFASGLAPEQSRYGTVHILFGGRDLPQSVDLADSDSDVTLVGPGSTSFFGDSLATGDVNGDGINDLIIGATFARSPDASAGSPGATYVVFGSAQWPATLNMAAGEYDVAVFAFEDLDELGDTVESGDINDDGIDDIIMTAEAADGPDNTRSTAAEVHVVFGANELSGDLFISQGDQDLSVLGADSNDTLGFSLAAGDVTGDGVDDLIMGARGDNGAMNTQNRVGAIYLVFGSDDLPPVIDLADPEAPIAGLYGRDAADTMNFAIVGDLQGDGDHELLIGAGSADGPDNSRSDAGDVYVLDSATVASLPQPVGIGTNILKWVIFGAGEADRLGTAMTVADFNADGRPELAVLAADGDGPGGARVDAGQVYLITLAGP